MSVCISAPYRPSQSTSVTSHPALRKGSPTDPVPLHRKRAFGMFYRGCDYCHYRRDACHNSTHVFVTDVGMRVVYAPPCCSIVCFVWFGIHTIRTSATCVPRGWGFEATKRGLLDRPIRRMGMKDLNLHVQSD